MGRKLVDATNACRIRRTRGDMAFLRLFALAERVRARVFGLGIFLSPVCAWLDVFFSAADAVLLAGGLEDVAPAACGKTPATRGIGKGTTFSRAIRATSTWALQS